MSFGYAVQSILEVVGFAAIILGLIFEERIADWERSVIYRIRHKLSRKSKIVSFESYHSDGKAV